MRRKREIEKPNKIFEPSVCGISFPRKTSLVKNTRRRQHGKKKERQNKKQYHFVVRHETQTKSIGVTNINRINADAGRGRRMKVYFLDNRPAIVVYYIRVRQVVYSPLRNKHSFLVFSIKKSTPILSPLHICIK